MILRDHSKNTIIEAIGTNPLGFFLLLQPENHPGYEIDVMGDMIRFTTGLNHVLGNWILNIKFNEQNAITRITENMSMFRQKGLSMNWLINPSSTPDNILGLLENAGIQVPEEGSPGMACDLRELTEDSLEESLSRSDIEVTKTRSSYNLNLWRKVFQECFPLPETIIEMFLNLSSVTENYIALFQKKPIAISSILYYGGIVGIFNVATLPDYRGQGIGTTMTLVPLMEAKKIGYEIAWLESSEMGLNLYKRIGFQEYCRLFRCTYTSDG